MIRYQQWMKCIWELEEALSDKTQQRGKDPEVWIAAERKVMHQTVNELRSKRNRQPVAIAEIEKAERLAVGHVDYVRKFALYCAEIVFKEEIEESLRADREEEETQNA